MNELEKQTRRFDTSLIVPAMWDGVKKLDPRTMVKQPVMFLVWGGFLLSLVYTMLSDEMRGFHLAVTLILLVTLWFANFAEAIAEGRGKAQAATLRASKNDVMARRIVKDGIEEVASSLLRKGDIVEVRAGDYLPGDGEIIAGLASIDESAITGESAPVINESGGDFSSVIGGTLVVSDRIEVEITSNPGESFLDQMITLVEG